MTDWLAAIQALPAKPTRRGFLWSRPAEYGTPATLPGRTLEDIASAYGRPSWYLDEPATGGLIAGWPGEPWWALHFAAEGRCSHVIRRGGTELELSWRLRSLGEVTGRPMTQVLRWLGQPNSRSTGHEYVLLQWQRPGYHIALKFGADGKCTGVTHQYMENPPGASR
jgi:hypothetical protein